MYLSPTCGQVDRKSGMQQTHPYLPTLDCVPGDPLTEAKTGTLFNNGTSLGQEEGSGATVKRVREAIASGADSMRCMMEC